MYSYIKGHVLTQSELNAGPKMYRISRPIRSIFSLKNVT